MSASEDFIEVNVLPLPDGQSNAFCIELHVQDSELNPQPFVIILGFQMEDSQVPGLNLNEDAINQPEVAFKLAKDLLFCGSDEIPPLTDIPPDECLPGKTGYYYPIDTEMEFENQGQTEIKMQQWHVSIFQSPVEKPLDRQQLFKMIQNLFNKHL